MQLDYALTARRRKWVTAEENSHLYYVRVESRDLYYSYWSLNCEAPHVVTCPGTEVSEKGQAGFLA